MVIAAAGEAAESLTGYHYHGVAGSDRNTSWNLARHLAASSYWVINAGEYYASARSRANEIVGSRMDVLREKSVSLYINKIL